jgi:diacylglycerol kinase
LNKFILSFKVAFNGVSTAFKTESNLRIHFLVAILVIATSIYFHLTRIEFSIILLCVGLVISMELINTCIEKICDFIHPEKNDTIKNIKDISAAAVLILSFISSIIGLLIFLPKIFDKLIC